MDLASMGASPALSITPRVPAYLFEGLLHASPGARAALEDLLFDAGYDAASPEALYDIEVWQACVCAAHRSLFAHLGECEGFRALGRVLAQGFLSTMIGRALGATFPLLGPERLVCGIPLHAATFGPHPVQVALEAAGPRCRRAFIADPFNPPDLAAGALEVGLERARATPEIRVEAHTADGYGLLIRW